MTDQVTIIKEIKLLAEKIISAGGNKINIYCNEAIESELRRMLEDAQNKLPPWSLSSSNLIDEEQSEHDKNLFESDIIIIGQK